MVQTKTFWKLNNKLKSKADMHGEKLLPTFRRILSYVGIENQPEIDHENGFQKYARKIQAKLPKERQHESQRLAAGQI